MTLLDGSIDQLITDYEQQSAELVRSSQWTGLVVVMMGAAVGGVQRVAVPEADRIYPNQVYYTSLDGTQIGKAINVKAPNRYGRQIRIGYPPNDSRLHVYDIATAYEADPAADEVGAANHGTQHSLRNLGWGESWSGKVGEDVVMVEARQMWNVTLQPYSGTVLYLPAGWVMFGSSGQFWPGGVLADQAVYVPVQAGRGRWVLVELDRDLTLHYTYGGLFDVALPASTITSYIPARDGNRFPCGAALLKQGVSTITWAYIMAGMNLQAVPDIPGMMRLMNYRLQQLQTLIYKYSIPVLIPLGIYMDQNTRDSNEGIHGFLRTVATAQAVSSGSPINTTVGTGKVLIVVNAGSDTSGTITVTGTTIDRHTGEATANDTDTITIEGLTTDSSDTDAQGNVRWGFSNAYITSKWFSGSISLSTTDVNLSDVDLYLVLFEQFNDSDVVVKTLDFTGYVTNASAWVYVYLYSVVVDGDTATITREASVEIASVNANQGYRRKIDPINKSLTGATDGIFAEMYFGRTTQIDWQNVGLKIWAERLIT